MEIIIIIALILLVAAVLLSGKFRNKTSENNVNPKKPAEYVYAKKPSIMTDAERSFYERLLRVAGDRYYIFPQIHLSALMTNQTKGRYWKAAFQRINRSSVDFVLCDKQTMRPVYAIELDDSTHDSAKRQARDAGFEQVFASIQLPLVRFRNVQTISDGDIIQRFADTHAKITI